MQEKSLDLDNQKILLLNKILLKMDKDKILQGNSFSGYLKTQNVYGLVWQEMEEKLG